MPQRQPIRLPARSGAETAAPAPLAPRHDILRRAAWLVPVGLAGYGLRFALSWLVLVWADNTRFDPHGFGLLGDIVLLQAMAPVVLGLLIWLLWRRGGPPSLFAPGATLTRTVLSIVLLIVLGAPLPGQIWAVVLLPLSDSWPVLVSAVLWFAIAAVGRALAVATPAVPRARS